MNLRRVCLLLPLLVLVTYAIPIHAEDVPRRGFRDVPVRTIVLSPFTDAEVNDLVATLDALLANQKDPAQWGIDAGNYLWTFIERLQAGQLTAEQETRVLQHFDQIEREHPNDAAVIQKERRVFYALHGGEVAPDIDRKDFVGKAIRLSDNHRSVGV